MSYLIKDSNSKEIAFFTGDWVFIGDVGRADLRENVGNIKAKQAELAGMMYDTTRDILPKLDIHLTILPAHGAGTSCGKGLSKKNMDTL
jgi:glyoxylase-like metal-dependent hydrolase (beta-lactamase superfamily II)